jgi:hypothetical protein
MFFVLLLSSYSALFEKTILSHKLLSENRKFHTDISFQEKKALKNIFDEQEGVVEKDPQEFHKNTHPAKINLAALFEENNPHKEALYQLISSLIRKTYQNTSFYKKDYEYLILDGWIKAYQKNPSAKFDLKKIEFSDHDLKIAYYHMLKGSKLYDIENKQGYPRLLKLLMFKKPSSPLEISKASHDLLSLLFTPSIEKKIDEAQWIKEKKIDPETGKERETYHFKPITKDHLNKILLEEKYPLPDKNFWNLMKF